MQINVFLKWIVYTRFLNMEHRTKYISLKPGHAAIYKGSER